VFFFDPATNSYRVCCIEVCGMCDDQENLDCGLLNFNYSGTNGELRYSFSVPSGTPTGSFSLTGGTFGSQVINLGSGTSTVFTFAATGTYTLCYDYTDADGCPVRCCQNICITGDPYECDLIQRAFNAEDNTWKLSLADIDANNVAFWQNDRTFEQFGEGQTSVSVPNPAPNTCGYYSVKIFDPVCGGYILCCVEICNEGCGGIEAIDIQCTDDPAKYTFDFQLLNNTGRPNMNAEFTLLSPLGVTFQNCENYLTVNGISASQTLNFMLEGCIVPLTSGMTVTIKVTLRDADDDSNWCCHLDPIEIPIPECDDCFGTPDPDLSCITLYDPVCGCDGVTYSNDCEAERAGIKSITPGSCCDVCPDDPLNDLDWMSTIADGMEIIEYKLDGKCVYAVSMCDVVDGLGNIYDCSGNVICTYGGIGGAVCDEFSRMRFQRAIQTCPAPNTNATSVLEDRSLVVGQTISLTNVPNPFQQSTTVIFELPEQMETSLQIYDTNGKLVFTQDQALPAGEHRILLDLKANGFSAGLYYYRLQTSQQTITKTMILID
ncbi:MAG: T9SS type A sorting domain-containing protein, partial [Bacteroidota bacterium]